MSSGKLPRVQMDTPGQFVLKKHSMRSAGFSSPPPASQETSHSRSAFGGGMSSAQALLHRLSAELLLSSPDLSVIQLLTSILLEALSQHTAGFADKESLAHSLTAAVVNKQALISDVLNRDQEACVHSAQIKQGLSPSIDSHMVTGNSWDVDDDPEQPDCSTEVVQLDSADIDAVASDSEEVSVLDYGDDVDPALAQELQQRLVKDPLRLSVSKPGTSESTFCYMCQQCNLSFVWRRHMEMHFADHRSPDRSHLCHICGKTFMRPDHLNRHANCHGLTSHICQLCGDGLPTALLLDQHWKSEHKQPSLLTDAADITPSGERRSASAGKKKPPMTSNPPQSKLQGKDKQKGLRQQERIIVSSAEGESSRSFLRSTKESAPVSASGVPITFVSYLGNDSTGVAAESGHHGEFLTRLSGDSSTMEQSPVADRASQPSKGLAKRFANTSTPTIAKVKGSTAMLLRGLRRTRPLYRCHICGRPFDRQAHLRRHVRIHSGERPYQCPLCLKAYSRGDYLRSHILTLHDQSRVQCKACSMVFAKIGSLRSHHCPVVAGGKLRTWYLQCEFLDVPVDMTALQDQNRRTSQDDEDHMMEDDDGSDQLSVQDEFDGSPKEYHIVTEGEEDMDAVGSVLKEEF